jgi:hypothetical protein
MKKFTGWEFGTSPDALRKSKLPNVENIVRGTRYPSALNEKKTVLLAIRPYHPKLNCSPDDENYKSASHVLGMAYFTKDSYTWFYLPKSFTYLSVLISGVGPKSVVSIETREHGVKVTNIQQLFRHLSNMAEGKNASDEKRLLKGFAALTNTYDAPLTPIRVTEKAIQVSPVGTLHRDTFDTWFSGKVTIPWLGSTVTVTVMEYNPQDPADSKNLPLIEKALRDFLALKASDKAQASKLVLKNCHEFIEAVGEEDWNTKMAQLKPSQAAYIWNHVQIRRLAVQIEKGTPYVRLLCDCDWEEEHGLQLVYQNGTKLTRVSEQDGHLN